MAKRVMSRVSLFFWLASLLLLQTASTIDQVKEENGHLATPVQLSPARQTTSGDRDFDGLSDATEIAGWSNSAGGPYYTDPANLDSDNDGLTDGEEQLFNTHPLDRKNPGIYVRYDSSFQTRKYYPWQKHGDKYIAHGNATNKAVVVRRGATLFVGGPRGATLEIEKSQSALTTLSAVAASCGGDWTISIPADGTVGKYTLRMSEGSWNKTLNLYVIFEIPASLTQAEVATYLYADDLADDRDEYAIWVDTNYETNYSNPNYQYYGWAYPFGTDQYDRYVFEDYVIGTINGKDNLRDAFEALAHKTDQVTRFDANVPKYTMQKALFSPQNRNHCSSVATVLVGFARSAGVPSRAIVVDWKTRHYDTSTEGWVGDTWLTTRAWNTSGESSGGPIEGGIYGPNSQYYHGHNKYTASEAALVFLIGPNWIWNDVKNLAGQGHCGSGDKRVYKTWYLREQGRESPPLAPGHIEHAPSWLPVTVPYWGWPAEPTTERLILNGCTTTSSPSQVSVDTLSTIPPLLVATRPQMAHFNRVLKDYGVDVDGNGRYNSLVIEVEVEVSQPGNYTIIGHLKDKTPTPLTVTGHLASASTYTYLASGLQTVKLEFNGLTLYENGEDGAYILDELWLSDLAYPEEVDLIEKAIDYQSPQYQTAIYSRNNFENGGANLTRNYNHTAVDTDQDGYVDTLILNTGLNINRPGTYRVEAELVDGKGQPVATAAWTSTGGHSTALPFTTFLPLIIKGSHDGTNQDVPFAGSGSPVSLQFKALLGEVSTYRVQNINLYNERGELVDSDHQSDGLNSASYVIGPLYASGLASLANTHLPKTTVVEATSVDADQDGDWDSLDFTVKTVLAVPGNYRLEAWLASSEGALLAWQTSEPIYLTPGSQELHLSFAGQIINAAKASGPYKLMALKVLFGDGYKVIDEVDVAYETSAFSFDDFDDSLSQNGDIPGSSVDNSLQATNISLCPAAYFTTSSPDILEETTVFTNSSTGNDLTFAWDFGDGSPIDTSANPTYTYPITGAFTVVMTATNSYGSDTAIQQVVVDTLEPPVASFTTSSPDILGETTVFTNASTGSQLTFAWDFGDGSPIATDANPTHTYTAPGTFTTLLTITNGLGSNTASGQVTINPPAPPSPSLRGYWPLDESSGQRQDGGTLANHLADVNTVASAAGPVSLAADFESSNGEHLHINDVAQSGLNITGSLTLVGWMNLESLGQTMMMASKYDYGTTNRAYRFGVFDTKVLHFVASPDGQYLNGYILNGKTVLQSGRWYHVAAVYDATGRTIRLYLDGVLEATKTVSFSSIKVSTAPFILGGNMQGSNVTQHFDGLLDDWRVYAQALSQTEIQELMGRAATPTPTPPGTPTPTPTFTPTPTNTPTPTQSDLIFADGFEFGHLSAWSSSKTDNGDLSASTVAALLGSNGLQAVIDDSVTIYVTDDRPSAEARYRARFYFDPNSISMASGNSHRIFYGFTVASTATDVLRVELRFSNGNYQLRAGLLSDGATWKNSSWFTISDAPHSVELDWQAATAMGANNGSLTLWLDDTQQANLTGVDNDTWRIDRARLGVVAGIDSGTSGTHYFDAFESRRHTYIGP